MTFSRDFNEVRSLPAGGQAFFGLDVLQELVDGIRAELRDQKANQSRWRWGTAVLGCAMWMDDPDFMQVLRECSSVCVVVTKQVQGKRWPAKTASHLAFLKDAAGLAQEAFPELAELAATGSGPALVVGPGTASWNGEVDALRELGFRKTSQGLVPIVHAKIALVGSMMWTDEHPSGHVVDEVFFRPRRLWIGSANFTERSRGSLEMGMWSADPGLMESARSFLLKLVADSEPFGSGPDHMDPELRPVEYDDEAMIEYLRDMGPPEYD